MKKLFLSLVAVIMAATATYAQSQVATLTHEGNVRAFYGYSAFQEAHDAAEHGDIITLSSGNFKATDITKAITIRGAGMQTDYENDILPTYVCGDLSIIIPDSVTEKLNIEGIQFTTGVVMCRITYLKDAVFRRCYIDLGGDRTHEPRLFKDVLFIQCKILRPWLGDESNITAINCYLWGFHSSSKSSSFNFVNCDIESWSSVYNSNFVNCILWGNSLVDISNSANYCVGSSDFDKNDSSIFKNMVENTNKVVIVKSIFKSFDGDHNVLDEMFELTDEAKATYLGNDGTEVGMHGGQYPFTPIPDGPRIIKCNVAKKSSADNKLSVDIEVSSAE